MEAHEIAPDKAAFAFVVAWSEAEGDPATELGALHGGDIPYVFGNLHKRAGWPWKPHDHFLSGLMSAYWLQFARTGNPNAAGLPEWPRFEEPAAATLYFGDPVRVAPALSQRRLAFRDRYCS